MAKATFINAFLATSAHEGGYVNDPLDRGGETYKGIARKFWPDWSGWAYINTYKKAGFSFENNEVINKQLNDNLGLQMCVEDFYKEHFWNVNHCYQFDQVIANELYDTAVNQGAKTAAKYFQKALNKLNRNAKDYADLKVDGNIGFNTINAYAKYMATQSWKSRSGWICSKWLLSIMNFYQLEKYMSITDMDLSQERFVPGWLNRV